jgi:hypothetical protein
MPGAAQTASHPVLAIADQGDMPTHNGLCLVCHMDFVGDPIAEDHMAAGITCAHCHGESSEHMQDETLMTPPDILFGRSEVDGFCTPCHQDPHRDPAAIEAFLDQWADKKRENGRWVNGDSICTDCHGLHTIARR